MISKVNRSRFLTTIGMGIVAMQFLLINAFAQPATPSSFSGGKPKFWIDNRFAGFKTPWRKVHLDFHNSHHQPKIGADFNAEKWGDQLVAGNVDGIVVFAKDMHGYFYYPSKFGPVHPGLSFDLLGQQVKACRERNIAVYAYYCAAWDDYLCKTRPEWRMKRRDGSDWNPQPGETPGWTALCLGNKDFVDLMANHIQEFVLAYKLDGAWLDMAEPIVPECYCKECISQIKAEGKDPFDKEVQRAHQNKNFLDFHRRMRELVHTTRPGCQIDFNDIGLSQVSERASLLDNIDIEALPTDPQWGYFFAPLQIRYQRNFGIPVYGMTGRFVSSWADFGGLKLPQQLDVELASLVANTARCDVGDQMPPNGVLDPAVYHVLGKSYGKIKRLTPWIDQAAPVTEAALMIPGTPMERVKDPYLFGLTKLLVESKRQFDVVEPGQEWERYNLVIIPDGLKPDAKTIDRLHKYIAAGGAVVVCHQGGLDAEKNESWLERYGLNYKGESAFKPAYFVTDDNFIQDMPGYAYALYNGASQWETSAPAKSLAQLGEPLFQRSAEHYTSHRQSPFDHITRYSALAISGKVGFIAFPLGESYNNTGYWIYREAFLKLINQVCPTRLVETNAPLNTEITVTYQAANKGINRPERYMVHLVNWSSTRKTPVHPEVHEDPVPLANVKVKLNIPVSKVKVKTVVSGIDLKTKINGNGIEVYVPTVLIHEIVCFELY
ncbi:MAG: alpha-amylase family protein [Bacteroidales bacterium]